MNSFDSPNTENQFWMKYFSETQESSLDEEIERLSLEHLTAQSISSPTSENELQELFDFQEVPEEARSLNDFVHQIENCLIPHTINTGSPYFIGHMTSQLPSFTRSLSKLMTTLNQNQVKLETAKSTTFLERQILGMLHHSFYGEKSSFYKEQLFHHHNALGVITSGGTIANATALQLARDHSLAHYGDVAQQGLTKILAQANIERCVVICSSLAHYSIKKVLGMLGLGQDNLLVIPIDQKQQINTQILLQRIQECQTNNWHIVAIVALAGSTECGSYDDLATIADIAQQYNIHLHLDAAWGGPVIFSEKYKHLLSHVEQVDSITIDGHKQLYSPMGLGIVLFKNPTLAQTIRVSANYIIRQDSFDLGKNSLEGSRPAMAVYLQAILQLFGKQGLGELLEKNISTAKKLASYIDTSTDFELLTSPQANIFLYRYIPYHLRAQPLINQSDKKYIDQINIKLQETQKKQGQGFVSRTKFSLAGNSSIIALRVVIANPLTSFKHCLQVLEEQRKIVNEIITKRNPRS